MALQSLPTQTMLQFYENVKEHFMAQSSAEVKEKMRITSLAFSAEVWDDQVSPVLLHHIVFPGIFPGDSASVMMLCSHGL